MLHVLMNHMKLHDMHIHTQNCNGKAMNVYFQARLLVNDQQSIVVATNTFNNPLDIDGSPSINSLTRTLSFLVTKRYSMYCSHYTHTHTHTHTHTSNTHCTHTHAYTPHTHTPHTHTHTHTHTHARARETHR